jgi:hypothetical protein
MRSTEFWVLTPCSWDRPDVSEEYIAPIFRIEAINQQTQAASRIGLFFDFEDGTDMFLRNIGLFSEPHSIIAPKTLFVMCL